jgi:hypothetical protein
MKTKEFTITENILASGQRFLNVIIDLVFIYILILSAGTTIVLIAEATNNFAVSSWENMNFVEIIAYGLLILFYYFNRFLANLGEINYSNYCCQRMVLSLQSK